jgi:hypothetical protein
LAGGPREPELEALLAAIQARAAAAVGQADEAVKLMARAERAIAMGRDEPASPWVNRFDEGTLASETARCLARLGHLQEARHQAERVLALRPAGVAPRSHAFGSWR